MDDYVAFIEAAILEHDPRAAARQKAIEENIAVPFQMSKQVNRRKEA